MKIERFEDLIDWTRDTHQHLSKCLSRGASEHEENRAKWMLAYVADHEKALANTVARIEKHADPKALHTFIFDYLEHNPVTPSHPCMDYASMSIDEISREIFAVHNQLIDLYRSLAGRADIEGARDVANELLDLEEHETMRLAQQVMRIHEI